MTNEYKANLWNECLKQNLFSDCKQEELPKVQELFEQTIEENKDVNTNDFISILGVKIKQMTQLSYKDLIPNKKKPIIDFSDNIEEEPLKDIDQLIAEKQKERQNDEPINKIISKEQSIPIIQEPIIQAPIIQAPIIQEPIIQEPIIQEPIIQEPILGKNKEINEIKYMVQQQNKILEQLLESQIKILRHLQKK